MGVAAKNIPGNTDYHRYSLKESSPWAHNLRKCESLHAGNCRALSQALEGVELKMKVQDILSVVLFAAAAMSPAAQAKEKHYQSGKLLRMDSVPCGMDQKNGKSIAGEMLGTDAAHMKTKELLCPEYVLETDKIVYHIRPKDDKHPALLPIGEKAQFRLEKDKMVLRVEDMDDKDREYFVVSMTPNTSSDRDDSSVASSR